MGVSGKRDHDARQQLCGESKRETVDNQVEGELVAARKRKGQGRKKRKKGGLRPSVKKA